MKPTLRILLSTAVLSVCTATSIGAQDQKPLSSREATLTSFTAKVEAIDHTTREVTLKGPLGNSVTFTVDKRVARLNEIKAGDEVIADYYVSLAAEVRPPTANEIANPITIVEGMAKAPAGTEPAGGGLRIVRVVVTIEGLDRPTKSLTVAGPKGQLLTVQVADVANLSKVRIGDTMVVTYTEALAVSLQKRTK